MTKWILKAEEIYKSYYTPAKVPILAGVNLSVKPGETIAIMGRSGQGKSTLLHLLGTLEKPCSGQLEIVGQKISLFNKSKMRNQHIGFVFQSFHLLEDYTSLENVLWPAKIARENTSKDSLYYDRAMNLLEEVGLKDRAHFHTKLLSGGEKQRIAIARALCNDPDILFADEPSGNLDQQTSALIHDLLLGFVKKGNKTLIIVTHNQTLASLCDKRYTLHKGHLDLS